MVVSRDRVYEEEVKTERERRVVGGEEGAGRCEAPSPKMKKRGMGLEGLGPPSYAPLAFL